MMSHPPALRSSLSHRRRLIATVLSAAMHSRSPQVQGSQAACDFVIAPRMHAAMSVGPIKVDLARKAIEADSLHLPFTAKHA